MYRNVLVAQLVYSPDAMLLRHSFESCNLCCFLIASFFLMDASAGRVQN